MPVGSNSIIPPAGVPLGDVGAPGGVAPLDGSGHVPDANVSPSIARDSEVVLQTEKAAANGVATLNGSSVIPSSQVSQASVTQHEAQIDHDALANYAIEQHRTINDAGSSTTDLWSAAKIGTCLAAAVSNQDIKDSVETVSTGSISLSGEQTLDGVLTSASRVGVPLQTNKAENGIYRTGAGAWTREPDADEDAEVTQGLTYFVASGGLTKSGFQYLLISPDPLTVGVSLLNFIEIPRIAIGTTSGTACEGNDPRLPTQDENDALVGTSGAPSTSNKYVTNADARNSDERTPLDDSATNAKLANMAQATIKGRASGAGTGDPVDLSAAQIRTILNVEDGADATLDATASIKGKIELATQGEVDTGTDTTRAVTPSTLANFSGLGGFGAEARTFMAEMLDSPNNSDWAVNALAPLAADSNNAGLTVRRFDDTAEEGVGFSLDVPAGATNLILKIKSRAETAPGAARTVGLKLYERGIPSTVDAWSAGLALDDLDFSTNENWEDDSQTIAIATLGLVAGQLHQLELTRIAPTAGTNLGGDWSLLQLKVEWS